MRLPFTRNTDGLVLGTHRPWYKIKRAPFVIAKRDIQQHGHIIGLSGFGKSKHIANLRFLVDSGAFLS